MNQACEVCVQAYCGQETPGWVMMEMCRHCEERPTLDELEMAFRRARMTKPNPFWKMSANDGATVVPREAL